MKVLITAILIAILFSGCCPSVTESITSNTTYRDTTFTPPPIEGQGEEYDPEFWNAIYGELERLSLENDSLRGLPPDTVKVLEQLQAKPFRGRWEIFKVTPNGDSVWVTFRLKNGNGTFDYRVIGAPVKAKIPETNTVKVQEKQPTWYEKIWADFENVFLVLGGLAVGIVIGVLFQRFRLKVV